MTDDDRCVRCEHTRAMHDTSDESMPVCCFTLYSDSTAQASGEPVEWCPCDEWKEPA